MTREQYIKRLLKLVHKPLAIVPLEDTKDREHGTYFVVLPGSYLETRVQDVIYGHIKEAEVTPNAVSALQSKEPSEA